MTAKRLSALNITEYNLLANKDPKGSYDRNTRENLYWIIEKLRASQDSLSRLEAKLYQKFQNANFTALEEKEKRVKLEVRRYQLSNNVKQTLKLAGTVFIALAVSGAATYEFVLDSAARQKVDVAYYAGLNKLGLVSKEDFEHIKQDLTVASTELKRTQEGYQELSQTVEKMILNNKVAENFKYILKQIYNNPRTDYVVEGNKVTLKFNGKEIANYISEPQRWYLVGIVENGVTRVYYDNQEILEIETIFGRKGEETPLGEYEIANKVYKPTWYKREVQDGKTRVRAIPFGDPEHEIGYWWMGLNKLDNKAPGSYGIHGVNASKINEFYKKNFDWRSGSAGCPNIQDWYLHFLAKVLPAGARVAIVDKDKWIKVDNAAKPPAPANSGSSA